jgi:CHAT domain-containing protein
VGNPYNYHIPVQHDDMFYGRAALLQRLTEGLVQPTPISSAVFGGRRFGKTSLLRKLARDMRPRNLPAGGRILIPWYYDPQAGYPISCSDDFFLLVLDGLRQALCADSVPAKTLKDAYASALRLGPVHAFEESFRRLTDAVEQRVRLVVLIDEAEVLFSTSWGADLRPNLRSLLSNSGIVESVALVMAGSTTFHTQVTEKDSPLENILTRYSLSGLTHQETLALARTPSRGQLSEEAAEESWVQTGGHPCLVQFIMQELWSDLPDVRAEDVREVAWTFSDRLNHFERWGDALSPLAHEAYRWLVRQEDAVSYGSVRRAFPTPEGGDLSRALDTLVYHGLVQATGRGRRTQYAIAGQMFCDWYLGERPVENATHAQTPSTGLGPGAAAQSAQPPLAFDAFDVEIETCGAGRYEIQVLSAPVGPTRSLPLAFDPAGLNLQAMLERIKVGDVDAALLTAVGQRLHAFLFPERIRAAYLASREAARRTNRGLRLALRLHQTELAVLPWELLYDPQEACFLALSGHTSLVRSLSGALVSPLQPALPPWRLLLVTASPQDWPRLDVEQERETILGAVAPLVQAGQMRVECLDHATPAALLAALRAGHHWLHFIGHGEFVDPAGGALVLERDDGTGRRLGVDALRHLLPEAHVRPEDRLRMVVLNACATAQVGIAPGTRGLAQTLVRAGLPTALGMGRPVADASARAFSTGFYGALAERGGPFSLAVTEGRRRVMVETGLHNGDWAVPVLFERR